MASPITDLNKHDRSSSRCSPKVIVTAGKQVFVGRRGMKRRGIRGWRQKGVTRTRSHFYNGVPGAIGKNRRPAPLPSVPRAVAAEPLGHGRIPDDSTSRAASAMNVPFAVSRQSGPQA